MSSVSRQDPLSPAEKGTLLLRPHHLLCTQGYSGRGYSRDFVRHMDRVVEYLRNDPEASFRLIFSTDDLCCACPHKKDENLCDTNEKVTRFDRKLVHYFQLEEKIYHYKEIISYIDRNMTEEMLADICEGCEWYPISACRRKILGTGSIQTAQKNEEA